ncbi:MAG TPA: SpoIIE family protein phosphatase [Terracidiphilus sp.]|nr:SpoIIE family protein phosphatase [Terracidiphilus sp.]
MKTIRETVAKQFAQIILCGFAAVCFCALPVLAQPSASPGNAAGSGAASGVRGVTILDGQWRFQAGDDLRWAEPGFDDSSWPTVSLSSSLAEQGIDTYSGYGWYRLKIQPQQIAQFGNLASSEPLSLVVSSNSVGQLDVFVNGMEAGHTKGMTESPSEYQSPPFVAQLNPSASGPTVIAIRTWAGPDTPVSHGLLRRVELGAANDMAERHAMAIGRQWNEGVISDLVVAFLFVCVAVLGGFLYMAQRHHPEYLWLALLCLSVAAGGAADSAFGLAIMPLSVYRILTMFSGRIFMAVTLEFVLHFTGTKSRRVVRGVQIGVVLVPFVSFIHLTLVYQILSVASEVLFCGLVVVLLFQAWRAGKSEAGVMLLPFFLAATADSANTVLDFAASRHWLPDQFASHRFYFGPIEFGIGTIAYTIFLGSLIAVILYRFVRISQEEQRSAAEISAARSVQALLIPTQLPSNRNFMLESAYLPVNGVGGDFFQVLPLKDDSLLIVVGDVSGKGLQAAMNSSTLVGALRNELSHDPATVLNHLNHVLIGAVSSPGTAVKELDCAPCFATCLCARVYPDGTTTIANAGHLNPYRDGREISLAGSLPLGVIADAEYEQATFQLKRGDRLVFLSDGVVEATNGEGELFGFERTQQVSNESARYIAQTAQHFGQTDDITVVSLYLSSKTAQPSSEELAYSK